MSYKDDLEEFVSEIEDEFGTEIIVYYRRGEKSAAGTFSGCYVTGQTGSVEDLNGDGDSAVVEFRGGVSTSVFRTVVGRDPIQGDRVGWNGVIYTVEPMGVSDAFVEFSGVKASRLELADKD